MVQTACWATPSDVSGLSTGSPTYPYKLYGNTLADIALMEEPWQKYSTVVDSKNLSALGALACKQQRVVVLRRGKIFGQGWLDTVPLLHWSLLVLLFCTRVKDPESWQAVYVVWHCPPLCGVHGRHNSRHLWHQPAVQPSP